MTKTRFSVAVDPEVVRRVDQERRGRRDEDGRETSRSAVVQEALLMWLEVAADEDRERMTRVGDRIEATQELLNSGVERLAKMVYRAQLAGEMSYQLFVEVSPKGSQVDREEMRGRAARQLDADRRRDVRGREARETNETPRPWPRGTESVRPPRFSPPGGDR